MIHSFVWYMVEAGTSLFEVILILTFLNGFLSVKEMSVYKKAIILIVTTSLLFMGSTLLYNLPDGLVINFLSVTIVISLLLYTGKLTHHLFSCFLLLAILAVVELISVFILALSLNIEAESIPTDPLLKLIGAILKNIFSYAVIKIIINFRKSVMREAGRVYLFFLLIIPLVCIFLCLVILDIVLTSGTKHMTAVLIAFLGLMYVNAIVFGIFEALMRQMDKGYKYKLIENQLELQLNHYNKLAESRQVLHEALHDFKNHVNCIYNLYKYKNYEELGRYIENLINVSNTEKVVDTGNPVIDALLNDKFSIAKKIGIDFKKELNLPSNLRIAPADICAILGNSLDNAIEACKRIKGSAMRREISLSMTCKDSYLIVVVTNTFDQPPLKEGRFFRSLKPSPELHGLGMHSIDRTVRKYDGNMVVKCDQGLFKLEIVMSAA